MDDFANILERDYGLKPQGKSSPMSAVKSAPPSSSIGMSASAGNAKNGTNRRSSTPHLAEEDLLFDGNAMRSSSSGRHTFGSGAGGDLLGGGYDDVFGGPPKFAPSPTSQPFASFDTFDDVFRTSSQKPSPAASSKGSSFSVFEAPVYDDDTFRGVPGIRSVDVAYDDVFNIGSVAAAAAPASSSASYDDLLGGFGSSEARETNTNTASDAPSAGESAFDELLPGFGGTVPAKPQSSGDGKPSQHNPSKPVNDSSTNVAGDPFTVFGSDSVASRGPAMSASNMDFFEAPSWHPGGSGKKDSSNGIGESSFSFESSSSPDTVGPELSKSFGAAKNYVPKKSKPSSTPSPAQVSDSADSNDGNSTANSYADDNIVKERTRTPPSRVKPDGGTPASSAESTAAGSPSQRNMPVNNAEATSVDSPSRKSRQAFRDPADSPSHGKTEAPTQLPKVGNSGHVDEFWISIEDVILVTQPTVAAPPSRPPPAPGSKQGHASRKRENQKDKSRKGSGPLPSEPSAKIGINNSAGVFDELEEFASRSSGMGRDLKDDAASPTVEGEQMEGSAAATASGAAMREAIERAEVKLRQAKEAKDRDREEARVTRNREEKEKSHEVPEIEEEREAKTVHDREEREREEREREAREKRHREREREREKDRIAVERANEMARQRAAVERANAEVRGRESEKAVARAAEARARVERLAVERATAEARERHERFAVEKVRAAERAAAEVREKAEKEKVAAAREQQRRNENDVESFFKANSRPSSAPRQSTQPTDFFSEGRQSSEGKWRSSNAASNVRNVPSAPSMADDLTSLFGGSSAPGEFQEMEGEPADRRRARWDRHQHTTERAAKALDEKRKRDLQNEKEQVERHRAGELVDAEIKRWAAGKEGNLRALLSTLQYVLWPECGWQPLSLTDLITAAAVKKAYRKATLYVHPDKVQQKGATIQQKYIAEKVFDLLREAHNKFNSEELF